MSVEGCHVLVVDDDEMNRDMLSRRLLRHGYAVTVAQDGKQALALVTEHAFDLIVLDVMMPELDGLQVLQTLRKTYSMADLPVIMATARDRTEDVVHALQLGANDYVSKPLDFAVLAARVDTQLTLKRAHHATDGTPGQRAGDRGCGTAGMAAARARIRRSRVTFDRPLPDRGMYRKWRDGSGLPRSRPLAGSTGGHQAPSRGDRQL
jgi:DNA-binding response OmpR family regulator